MEVTARRPREHRVRANVPVHRAAWGLGVRPRYVPHATPSSSSDALPNTMLSLTRRASGSAFWREMPTPHRVIVEKPTSRTGRFDPQALRATVRDEGVHEADPPCGDMYPVLAYPSPTSDPAPPGCCAGRGSG